MIATVIPRTHVIERIFRLASRNSLRAQASTSTLQSRESATRARISVLSRHREAVSDRRRPTAMRAPRSPWTGRARAAARCSLTTSPRTTQRAAFAIQTAETAGWTLGVSGPFRPTARHVLGFFEPSLTAHQCARLRAPPPNSPCQRRSAKSAARATATASVGARDPVRANALCAGTSGTPTANA